MARSLGKSWRQVRKIALWARGHMAHWLAVAVPLDAALISLVAVLIALPGQRPATVSALLLALVILLVLSVVFPVAGDRAKKNDEMVRQEQDRRQRIDGMLAFGLSTRLPRLSELTDADLGATRTQYSKEGNAPYVMRGKADEEIRGLLAQPGPPYPFVIVWGTTKAGKSRTLAEALRAVFVHDPVIVVPRSGQALAELARLGTENLAGHRPAVVVLDDLDPGGMETLSAQVLQLVRGWAVIAATMTARRRADVLRTGSGVGVTARAALEASNQYELTSGPPAGAEEAEAERLYPLEHFDGSIAETLVGAPELIALYKASPDNAPAGCAIVRAAIDARRAGLARPVREVELRRLFPRYLRAVRIDLDPTSERFAEGMQWATHPITSQVALLRPTGSPEESPGWIIFDHAVTADEGQDDSPPRPIPPQTWAELIDVLPRQDTFAVAMAASARKETAIAITAFGKAATSLDDIVGPAAALNLGFLLSQSGDIPGAVDAYRQAIGSGHPDAAPGAALGLGNLLQKEGDVKGAAAAYRQASQSGHPYVTPLAALSLGNVLKLGGDVKGAEAAYRQASQSGPSDNAVTAAFMLGVLLDDQDDVEGARVAYQQVIDSGHSHYAPTSALALGDLLKRHNDLKGAGVSYRKAAESGHPDQAPQAAVNLGLLLYDLGDLRGAEAAYQQAIDSGHPKFAPLAWIGRGNQLKHEGDVKGAAAAYRQGSQSGPSDNAVTAAFMLGDLLDDQDDVEGARVAYQQVIDSGDSKYVARAWFGLGSLMLRVGDLASARFAFQQAIDSAHASDEITSATQALLQQLGLLVRVPQEKNEE